MNPTVQTLDPKLQEAYNRVMGTDVRSPLAGQGRTDLPKTTPGAASESVQAPTQIPQAPAQAATSYVSSKKGIPWWIYLLAGVTFFALYTLFWVRMFNINLF